MHVVATTPLKRLKIIKITFGNTDFRPGGTLSSLDCRWRICLGKSFLQRFGLYIGDVAA